MALFSAASLSPHSLMPLSCSSTSTSSSIIKLFSPVTRFSKTPQAFISSIPSTKIRDPSLSRLQLQPIRSSTSSSSIHGSEGEGDSSPPASRIFIKGLSRSTSEGCLLKTFSCFGEISKVKLITSKSSKQPLGLAYIWFVREEDALSAVKEMNGKFVDGRFMIVMMARPEAPSKHVRTAPYRDVTVVNGECGAIFILLAANIPAQDQKHTRSYSPTFCLEDCDDAGVMVLCNF